MLYLVPIIVFLGLLIGSLLKRWINEEVEELKKYFRLVEVLLLGVLGIYLLYLAFDNNIWFYLIFLLGLSLSFVNKEAYIYLGFGLLSLDFYVASLSFIYGLVNGNKNWYKKLIFFVPFVLLIFVQEVDLFLMFSSGALIGLFSKRLIKKS
jgi:hypothetical protein